MWSLGALIWPPIAVVLVAVVAYFARRSYRYAATQKGDPYGEHGIAMLLAVALTAVAALLVLGTVAGMYPYSADYHRWETQTGTVGKVSSRFLGNSDSTTQRFVVQFTDGRERACDDTRCALVKAGDRLTLSCKRHWQYAGQDGWDCNYVRRQP